MTSPHTLRSLCVVTLIVASVSLSCSAGKRCSPENCDTCCSAEGVCVLQTSRLACGAQGASCDVCSASEACVSGSCRSVSGEDGGSCTAQGRCANADGTCGASCPNGCCDSQGRCQAGLADEACGVRARSCVACPTDQSCSPMRDGGVCLAPKSDVFKPCTGDTDCAALGPQGICKRTTSTGTIPYSGGYCTHLCGRSGMPLCPGDSVCVGGADAYGEADAFCWKKCDTNLDCRGGADYNCYWNGPENLGCWLKPRPAPAGIPGSACTSDRQCGPPPDFSPVCLTSTLPDGGESGFTGGSCAVDCDIGFDEQCGPTGLCTPMPDGPQIRLRCQQACTNLFRGQGDPTDGGCRAGYVCRGYVQSDGGLEPRGACVPNCNAAGPGANGKVGCPTGLQCQTSGHCCSTSGCL